MKNQNVGVRHGDLSFHPLQELPEGLKKVEHDGSFVLARGEHTGHTHTIHGNVEILQDNEGRFYLNVLSSSQVSHEEHKTITLEPGVYRQDSELERDPFLEQIRKVVD